MGNITKIRTYLLENMFNHGDLYVKCLQAKAKYNNMELDPPYYYSDEDYDNFLMLASAWSAIIRKTWRRFIIDGDCEPFQFWNAFVKVATFNQTVLMIEQWSLLGKHHSDLKKKIAKTSNPEFIEKMFTGMDWNWLCAELSKLE